MEKTEKEGPKEPKVESPVREEPPRTYPDPTRFSSRFPYELTPYYDNPGLIGKGGFARVFRANRKIAFQDKNRATECF